jgi:hypothetical protein
MSGKAFARGDARRAYVSRNPMLARYESREAAGGAARYSSPTWGKAYREDVRPEGPPPLARKCGTNKHFFARQAFLY